ncbi:MAG: alginate export family protein [Sphingomonas sp.]
MSKTTIILMVFAAMPFAAPISAQEKPAKKPPEQPVTLQGALGNPTGLTISGSVRARYEVLDNQFRPGLPKRDDLLALRTTLFAQYDAGPVRIGAELVDARAYFTDAGSSVGPNEVDALELTQAYIGFDLEDALGKGSATSIDAGRFTMDLGSRRLVGRNQFRNAINSFTGVRAQIRAADKSALTVFVTLPQTRLPRDRQGVLNNRIEFDRESFDSIFWGVFGTRPKAIGRASLDLYFYGLNERDAPGFPTRNRQLYTPGARLYASPAPGKTDYDVEGVYQLGSARATTAANAPRSQVSAWSIHAEVGRQFDVKWRPRVAVVYDLASGDHPGGDNNRFDTLFGVRRADFGPTGIYGPLGRSNISSPGVRLEVTPDTRLDGAIMYRAAFADSASDSFASSGVRDPSGASGRFAGHQIESRVRYWIVPKLLRADVGGALLVNGRLLNNAPNANRFGNPIYGYFDTSLTF